MKIQSQSVHVPQSLPCVIERDRETNLFVGHCLTYDLVSTAKNKRDAIENLKGLIKCHIEYSYTHHKAGFSVTADESDWLRWREMVKSGELVQTAVEPIEVCFNEPWDSPAFWASVNISKEAYSSDGAEADHLCAPR